MWSVGIQCNVVSADLTQIQHVFQSAFQTFPVWNSHLIKIQLFEELVNTSNLGQGFFHQLDCFQLCWMHKIGQSILTVGDHLNVSWQTSQHVFQIFGTVWRLCFVNQAVNAQSFSSLIVPSFRNGKLKLFIYHNIMVF